MPTQTRPAGHGPVSGPINACLGAVVIALTVRLAHQPLWLPAVIAAFGALGALVVGVRRKSPAETITYRCGCWVFAAAWSTWTVWRGMSVWSFVVLGGATLLAAVLAPAFAPEPDPDAAAAVAKPGDFFSSLAATIQRVCQLKDPVTVTPIRQWPNGAGWTVLVEFALGAANTWRSIADYQLVLAGALRLLVGCTITARGGSVHQGSAILDIALIDDVDTVVDYPNTYRPQSVRDEKPIGVYGDQTPALVENHQSAGLIGGMRGAGKTVLLHDMIGNSVQCVDELVVIVDLNGGNLAAAWCEAQARGEVAGVIDMIAVTDESALKVARILLAIAKDRKARYARLKLQHNVDILPVDKDLPAYTVYVDEGGEVTGDDVSPAAKEAAKLLREVQRIGRADCVNVVFSVQRVTSDYVPAAMKKAAALKIMGLVDDVAELAHMFDWVKGISVDGLRQGVFFLRRGQEPIRRVRTFRLLPRQIREIVFAVAGWRPVPDEAARQAGGELYATRWEWPDVQAYMARLRGDDDGPTVSADVARDTTPAVPAALEGMAPDGKKMSQLLAELKAPPKLDPIASVLAMDDAAIAARLADLEDSPAAPPVEPEAVADLSPAARLAFVVKLVVDAGDEGIKTEDVVDATIAAGFTARRQTVSEALAQARDKGLIRQKPGQYASWFGC